MILELLKNTLWFAALLLGLLITYVVYTAVKNCQQQKRLQDQWVYFGGTPFHCCMNDIKKFMTQFDDPKSNALDTLALFELIYPGPNKPALIGLNVFN